MPGTETVSATHFKAKCLDILDRINRRELGRVVVTKRGRVVAVLIPPEDEAAQVRRVHGFMRGTVMIPDGTDLAEPTLSEPLAAGRGKLHR